MGALLRLAVACTLCWLAGGAAPVTLPGWDARSCLPPHSSLQASAAAFTLEAVLEDPSLAASCRVLDEEAFQLQLLVEADRQAAHHGDWYTALQLYAMLLWRHPGHARCRVIAASVIQAHSHIPVAMRQYTTLFCSAGLREWVPPAFRADCVDAGAAAVQLGALSLPPLPSSGVRLGLSTGMLALSNMAVACLNLGYPADAAGAFQLVAKMQRDTKLPVFDLSTMPAEPALRPLGQAWAREAARRLSTHPANGPALSPNATLEEKTLAWCDAMVRFNLAVARRLALDWSGSEADAAAIAAGARLAAAQLADAASEGADDGKRVFLAGLNPFYFSFWWLAPHEMTAVSAISGWHGLHARHQALFAQYAGPASPESIALQGHRRSKPYRALFVARDQGSRGVPPPLATVPPPGAPVPHRPPAPPRQHALLMADFAEHPVAHQVAAAVACLEEPAAAACAGFPDTSVISTGPDNPSAVWRWLQRTAAAAARRRDAGARAVFKAVGAPVELIADALTQAGRRPHVLFDLQGHTNGSKPEQLAARLAPVTISGIAQPLPMGAPWSDWTLADPSSLPPDSHEARLFGDSLLYMPRVYAGKLYHEGTLQQEPGSPGTWAELRAALHRPHCYTPQAEAAALDALGTQVSSTAPLERPAVPRTPEEVVASLRGEGTAAPPFLFASFNNHIKIDPEPTFAAWMNALARAPNAALVVLAPAGSPTADVDAPDFAARFRSEAAARGIHPSRIIVSSGLPPSLHFVRTSFVDCALDPLVYGGHSTTLDLLQAGVPVLTVRGDSFARRVSAVFLDEAARASAGERANTSSVFAMTSVKAYEDGAVELAVTTRGRKGLAAARRALLQAAEAPPQGMRLFQPRPRGAAGEDPLLSYSADVGSATRAAWEMSALAEAPAVA